MRTAHEPIERESRDRFASWGRGACLAVVVATVGLIAYGLLNSIALVDRSSIDPDDTDDALYVRIADRVADGEGYYTAAVAEQLVSGYPVQPFITVREPTLAYVTVAVGGVRGLQVLFAGLGAVILAVSLLRMEKIAPDRLGWWGSCLLVALAGRPFLATDLVVMHEVWAGALIFLSLLVRSERRWVVSVVLGLLAAVVRELALPYLLVMATMAWRDGRRREMWGWISSIAAFGAFFAVHAALVQAAVESGGQESQGWLRFGGWPFLLDMVRQTTAFFHLPGAFTALIVPLALLGWWSLRSGLALRAFVFLAGIMAAFMAIGRPENTYWGLMLAIVLLPGLAFAPRALVILVAGMWGKNKNVTNSAVSVP